ncbi:hypothetical protein GCM10010236_08650 [Streptomyces eurythermus]|nr:hypothetical protein GCM10010236_08650 [Streptomyces eurythermus]
MFEALLEGLTWEAVKRGEVDLSLVGIDSTTARARHDAAGSSASRPPSWEAARGRRTSSSDEETERLWGHPPSNTIAALPGRGGSCSPPTAPANPPTR